MRRLSTASFLPFSSEMAQSGTAAYGQDRSGSNTATAVLELDQPAPDSRWGQSEFLSARSKPVVADNRLFFREKPFGAVAVSERASMMAAHPQAVVGVWRLLSSEATIVDAGKTEITATEKPKGYIILTPWGRMMTVCVGGDGDRKKTPTSQADFSELWKTMLAYTGKYRVEGDELITNVDVSWYELWTGTEQRRQFKLEGDKLIIVTKPQPIGTGYRANALVSCRVVWERED